MLGLVSIKNAAEHLGIKPDTVRRWAKDGRIPARFVSETKGKTGRRTTYQINIDGYLKHVETQGVRKQAKG